jgi:hypothetical protein
VRAELRQAYDAHRQLGTEASQRRFQCAKRRYIQVKKRAKRAYFNKLGRAAAYKAMGSNPKETWQIIKELQLGSKAHHKDPTDSLNLRDPDTQNIAVDDRDNIEIVRSFYQKLYNRDDAPIDPAVLADVSQREILWEFADPPTIEEMRKGINKMKNNKAPGESGVTAEAIKALSEASKEYVHALLVRFFLHHEISFDEWQEAMLIIMYKGKGDQKDLKNFRGIVLQDILARLTSAIIAARLNQIVQKYGFTGQYGSTGCADALYVVRSALQLRRDHGKDSHVLFVDLVKAYDTANHELLFPLLAKFGVPPPLVEVIRRLHRDFQLKFTLGKEQANIEYTVGVRQGDNMAPALFLFLMQAMAESLEKQLAQDNLGVKMAEFRYHRATATNRGRLRMQPNPERTKGTIFKLLQALFVDDQFVLVDTRDELIQVASTLRLHLKRFGLIMHVGELQADGTWTASKTEAMYFPASSLARAPTTLPPPAVFPDGRHRVEYTNVFKYLGCHMTPALTDEEEIRRRLRKAKNQMGALTTFFRTPADLRTKRLIFQSIPLNTALYGCESWTLPAYLKSALNTFFHESLRRILGLNMDHVQHFCIRNEHLRNKMSLPDIMETVHYRQFLFLGKIARLPETTYQRKFLNAWIQTPRPVGRPQQSLRHLHVETLQAILGDTVVDKYGRLADWIPLAHDATEWRTIGRLWLERCTDETRRLYGDHHLLDAPVEN